jgi:hypothetical protein
MNEVKKHAKDNAVVILIGNKCDLEHKRVISYEQGKVKKKKIKFHSIFNLLFFNLSNLLIN